MEIKKSGPKRVSAKSARLQKMRAPKIVENTKNAIFLRGTKTSEACGHALKELFSLRKPHGKMMQRSDRMRGGAGACGAVQGAPEGVSNDR